MIKSTLTSFLMISSVFNYRYGFFSLSDLLLLIFLSYLFIFKKSIYLSRNSLLTIIVMTILYLLSAQLNGYSNFNDEVSFYGFFYKYLFITSLFVVFTNITIEENFLFNIVLVCWSFLCLWAIYYAFFLIGNPLLSIIIPNQISFPGTGTGANINPDSHLYAYVVGCLGLYLSLFTDAFKRPIYFLITLFAVLLTGSRNPLALFAILLIFYFINSQVDKKIFLFLLLAFAMPFIASQLSFFEEILPTMRSFQFDFQNDSSAGNRVMKFKKALIEYKQGSLFVGQSVFGSQITWADGIHTILLIHFGPLGLIIYLSWVMYFFIKLYFLYLNGNKKALKLLYLAIYIFIGLFITEFILVSRGAILVLTPLIILITNLNNNLSTKGYNTSK